MQSASSHGQAVSVELTAEQAQHVAGRLTIWFEQIIATSAGERLGARGAAGQVADVVFQTEKYSEWFEQVGWGEASEGVTWTASRAEVAEMAAELVATGGHVAAGLLSGGLNIEDHDALSEAMRLADTGVVVHQQAASGTPAASDLASTPQPTGVARDLPSRPIANQTGPLKE